MSEESWNKTLQKISELDPRFTTTARMWTKEEISAHIKAADAAALVASALDDSKSPYPTWRDDPKWWWPDQYTAEQLKEEMERMARQQAAAGGAKKKRRTTKSKKSKKSKKRR